MIRIGILGHPKSTQGCFDGEFNPAAAVATNKFTPIQLWDEFSKGDPDLNAGIVLHKWVCVHNGQRHRDYAPTDGPALGHGDAVTFYVKKAQKAN